MSAETSHGEESPTCEIKTDTLVPALQTRQCQGVLWHALTCRRQGKPNHRAGQVATAVSYLTVQVRRAALVQASYQYPQGSAVLVKAKSASNPSSWSKRLIPAPNGSGKPRIPQPNDVPAPVSGGSHCQVPAKALTSTPVAAERLRSPVLLPPGSTVHGPASR